MTRLAWSAPGCAPVVLYRIEGGGHGWPGGPQFLPARVIGPVPRHLDATGLLLEMVRADSHLKDAVYQVTPRPLRVRKEVNRQYEALMMAEGEPAGAGRA